MYGINDSIKLRGSERSFKSLVYTYQEKVIRFISLFVFDEQACEELASDVFLSLWMNRQKLADVENLDNYLFIIAKNKALNHLRKGKADLVDLDEIDIDVFHHTHTTPESIFVNNETVLALNDVISQLPPKTRLAFHLIREQKMKYKDAAEILGVSVKTIEKQVAAAVKKLQEKLLK